jgi:aminopeptidase N
VACLLHADPAVDPRTHGAGGFGEPGIAAHHAPSRPFRIDHAAVTLAVDPCAGTLSGEATFTLSPLAAYDGVVELDGPTPDAVIGPDGAPVAWERAGRGVRIVSAACPGRLVLRWRVTRPEGGLYFAGPTASSPDREWMAWTQCQDEDAHFFMPCVDHPRSRHPWSIRLEAPAGYTLLSNGRLADAGEANGAAWAVWEQELPMPAYLFTAVIARLDVAVLDAPVPMRLLFPPGRRDDALRGMGRTPEMLAVLTAWTGTAFPWPRYDQVVVWDFNFGGMENTGCTTMTELLLVDAHLGPHWHAEELVMHELAHQWFGDLVTCRDWSQAWLNESFATFFEVVWRAQDGGEAEGAWAAFGQLRSYLEEDHGRYRRPIQSYDFREPIDVFDHHLYEKGAVVLRTLRAELGEPALRAGIQRYLAQHAHHSVHTRHLQTALEDATGVDLDRFFDQWIARSGHPVVEVTLGEAPGLVTVEVAQQQAGGGTPEVFWFGLKLEIVGADGATRALTLPVRERQRTFAVPVDGPVREVRVDPGLSVLADLTLRGPDAWLERLAQDPCPVLAARALAALARLATTSSLAAVGVALTGHPFWGVRADAARLLGQRLEDRGRDALLVALAAEPDPRVQEAIADALGGWREEPVAEALMAALPRSPTWHTRAALLHALGRTRVLSARPVLEAHLAASSWADLVVSKALAGLAALQVADVAPTLIANASRDRSERAAAAAATALAALGDAVEAVRTPAREHLERLARQERFAVRMAALRGLARLAEPASAGTLAAIHASAPDGRLQRAAWEALGRCRAGRSGGAAVGHLAERVDALAREAEALRQRVDRIDRG